ncbi:MAG: YdeI/OmpD-associated family protein [Pseudomonadota bacterium]
MGVALGDEVEVRFAVADQDAVNVPNALAEALETHGDLAEVWDSWTPGKRRGWAHRVASAKTAPTIAKRVDEVLTVLAES